MWFGLRDTKPRDWSASFCLSIPGLLYCTSLSLSPSRDSISSFCPFHVSSLFVFPFFLLLIPAFLSSRNQPFSIHARELSANPFHQSSNHPRLPQGRIPPDSRPHPPLADTLPLFERPLFLYSAVPWTKIVTIEKGSRYCWRSSTIGSKRKREHPLVVSFVNSFLAINFFSRDHTSAPSQFPLPPEIIASRSDIYAALRSTRILITKLMKYLYDKKI